MGRAPPSGAGGSLPAVPSVPDGGSAGDETALSVSCGGTDQGRTLSEPATGGERQAPVRRAVRTGWRSVIMFIPVCTTDCPGVGQVSPRLAGEVGGWRSYGLRGAAKTPTARSPASSPVKCRSK